jgi:hypothetical protein
MQDGPTSALSNPSGQSASHLVRKSRRTREAVRATALLVAAGAPLLGVPND